MRSQKYLLQLYSFLFSWCSPCLRKRTGLDHKTLIQFDLYNLQTDIKIQTLRNGTIVTFNSATSVSSLNIEAVVSGTRPASMQLSLDVIFFNSIQNGSRFSLCGNIGGQKEAKWGRLNIELSVSCGVWIKARCNFSIFSTFQIVLH